MQDGIIPTGKVAKEVGHSDTWTETRYRFEEGAQTPDRQQLIEMRWFYGSGRMLQPAISFCTGCVGGAAEGHLY